MNARNGRCGQVLGQEDKGYTMDKIVNQHKPFEIGRFEFRFFVAAWEQWKELNPHRLQGRHVKALDERIKKHMKDTPRPEVS